MVIPRHKREKDENKILIEGIWVFLKFAKHHSVVWWLTYKNSKKLSESFEVEAFSETLTKALMTILNVDDHHDQVDSAEHWNTKS